MLPCCGGSHIGRREAGRIIGQRRTGKGAGVFEGFALETVDLGEVELRVRHGGSGPPVVLLHGHPRTHTTWHCTAPALVAAGHSVVCPDLRGYGRSSKPETDAAHAPYSKRAMAADVLRLMSGLGHDRFAVVGHDRGAYVALRAALDHPERISHLGFLGYVPIGEALARCGARFATSWWHWFFFNVPGTPERVICADPDAWYEVERQRQRMERENFEDFLAAVRDPATVHAMLEDYRAGLAVDREHDDADRRAGRRVACPTLVVLASEEGDAEMYPQIETIWDAWAEDVRLAELATGHHMAEEAPEQLAALLADFLRPRA